MGITDKAKEMKDKAVEALGGDEKIDTAAEKADEVTGGKATDQIDEGAQQAKEAKDKLRGGE